MFYKKSRQRQSRLCLRLLIVYRSSFNVLIIKRRKGQKRIVYHVNIHVFPGVTLLLIETTRDIVKCTVP